VRYLPPYQVLFLECAMTHTVFLDYEVIWLVFHTFSHFVNFPYFHDFSLWEEVFFDQKWGFFKILAKVED
jgi:hypothetical protein